MKARDQGGTWLQCLAQLATQSPADGMLEEAYGRLQVGGVVGRAPQKWEAPRDRPIERGEAAGQHRVVAHWVEELDLKRVRVSARQGGSDRSEEHTSELQSHSDLVCRLLLEKKKKQDKV